MGERRSRSLKKAWFSVGLVAVLLTAGFFLIPTAAADRTPVMSTMLPTPRDGAAAVAMGDAILLFGGEAASGRLKDVARYDPVTGSLVVMAAQLPTGRSGAAAVWTGTHAYIFGGWTTSGYTDQILRYDPATDTLAIMTAKLPSARVHAAAAYADGAAYIFGGTTTCSPCDTDQILRYDTVADTLTVLDAKLPTPRAALAAATDGSKVYLFGGVTASPFSTHASILIFDAAAQTLSTSSAQLPAGRYHLAATWAAGRAWAIGGTPCTNNTYCEGILGYDPGTDSLQADPMLLLTGRHRAAAAAFGDHVYLMGGHDGARLNEILRFSPPGAPPLPERPELLPIPNQVARVGTELIVPVTATHPQGRTLTLSAPQRPSGASFTDLSGGNGQLVWTPAAADEGTHSVMVVVNDGQLSDTRWFDILVEAADAPYIGAIASRVIETGTQLIVDLNAWDPLNRTITLGIDPMPSNGHLSDYGNGSGRFVWTPTAAQAGVWAFAAIAEAGNKTGTALFQVTVRSVVLPPELNPLPAQRIVVEKPFLYTVTATHPDGDPVTLSAANLPVGAAFTDLGTGTGTISWTPHLGQLGAHGITIIAATEGRTTTGTLSVTVVREHDFRLTAETAIQQVMSPGEKLALPVLVENTGNQSLTIQFTAQLVQPKGTGWSLKGPAAVHLGPEESITVLLNVTATASSVETIARLRGVAEQAPSLSRVQNFVVKVPLALSVELESQEVTLLASTAGGVPGTVALTWANGSPATGLAVKVTQTPAASSQFASSVEGNTDATGRFTFDFRGDPYASLPGEHKLDIRVTRGGQTQSETSSYSVALV